MGIRARLQEGDPRIQQLIGRATFYSGGKPNIKTIYIYTYIHIYIFEHSVTICNV